MASIVCENCGAEIESSRTSCEVCGARRHRTASPEPWRAPRARRTALLAGIVLALLIVLALIWRIADSRRSQLEPPGRILPIGAAEAPARQVRPA